MRKAIFADAVLATVLAAAHAAAAPAIAADRVKTANGTVEGVTEQSGIHVYRGIPFAAPPVGDLRWKPPQPVRNWTGTRKAAQFGPRCVQAPLFRDMNFRSSGMSEDCLYLNVWTPAKSGSERLPVLVYFYGGGFVAGDGSEPRYDGESMARKGIVSLTVNYGLGVFGFLAEASARAILGANDPTPENFANAVQTLYGERARDALKVYAGSTPDEVRQVATDLASDRFIAYSTWKWADLHGKTCGKPVYRTAPSSDICSSIPCTSSRGRNGLGRNGPLDARSKPWKGPWADSRGKAHSVASAGGLTCAVSHSAPGAI
jgi:hypothetical protein